MIFELLTSGTALLLLALYAYGSRKKRALEAVGWSELVDRLQPVPLAGISRVALDYLHPQKGQLGIKTDELWRLVGAEEGIRRMQENAEVLILLAGFAAQWNFEESVIVAERMRRDGLALRRALGEHRSLVRSGQDALLGPFCIQQAASSYYLMRERLLALYETSHAGRYPQLVAVLH